MKITARTSSNMAIMPEIALVKYKNNTTAAKSILIVLSAAPIFAFIILIFNSSKIRYYEKKLSDKCYNALSSLI